jgi:transcriptional regulator with XRE-family HTH domain
MAPDRTLHPVGSLQQNGRDTFGRRLRHLRQMRRLRLADVAAMTGLAVSTISKAERGLMALTYDRLLQLANGLGIDMAALLRDEGQSFGAKAIAVARKGEFQRQDTPVYNYEFLFTDVWNKAMTPIAGTVKSHSPADFPGFNSHAGQEFVHVISGEVTIYFEGAPPVTLRAGESIYFDSSQGHNYTSSSIEDARILVVCVPCAMGGSSDPGTQQPANIP